MPSCGFLEEEKNCSLIFPDCRWLHAAEGWEEQHVAHGLLGLCCCLTSFLKGPLKFLPVSLMLFLLPLCAAALPVSDMAELSEVFLLLSGYACAPADSKLPSQLLSWCLFWIPDFHFVATDWSVHLLLWLPVSQRPLGAGTGEGVILIFLGLHAGLLCGGKPHSVLRLWLLRFIDRWLLWMGEFLSDVISKLGLGSEVPQ